ncbi:hypothetical protein [Bacillus suaedae]|uniref:Uncharacterized protein n=1 Tax=Halalkalibacter suaedae TaxID=2822140 RepID=A0A940WUV6_9BACI|nr:hypothetical protein [Bacillus suaedae]MBP3950703.1 hypothetical protein [Bacillus suaedae]
MKTNSFLIRLAIISITIFGGASLIRYLKTGELLFDQIIAMSLGVSLLIMSLIWRKNNKAIR